MLSDLFSGKAYIVLYQFKSAHFVYDHDVEDNQQPISRPLPTSIDTLVLETGSSSCGFCSSIERCLRQLQLNSLRSLDIVRTRNDTAFTHFESFIELVSEYKSLTSLRLCNVAFCNENSRGTADEGTLELLENLTSLESLEIVEGSHKADDTSSYILRDVFVHALTVSRVGNHYQQDTLILPVLQHLSFKGQGWHLSDKTLVDLVRSRWRPLTSEPDVDVPVESDSVTSLTSVQFVLTKRRCDPEVFQPLVNMAAAGLKVTVIDSFGRVV
jgi:hypothetical protein